MGGSFHEVGLNFVFWGWTATGRPKEFLLMRRARRPGAPRRRNNAPSSVIAYGDATFPPGWGRLVGRRFIGFPPQGGRLGGRPHGAAPTIHTTSVYPFRRGRCLQRPGDGGYFAPGRGTFHGWKVPKDPRAVVLAKYTSLGTPRRGHSSYAPLLVLSQPRPKVVVGFPGAPPPMISGPGAHVWITV